MGKSSCSSVAPKAANRSKIMSWTSWGRASGRSTLLMTTMGRRPRRQRLHGDELGLRHRPFGGVDQHEDAVDHAEDALDLAAEIGMAGRIDDVDARILPGDRGAFGQDGDAALALQLVGIHRALGDLLIGAEGAALAQQLVDQRGLAVVDMGDDGEVVKFGHDWASP